MSINNNFIIAKSFGGNGMLNLLNVKLKQLIIYE